MDGSSASIPHVFYAVDAKAIRLSGTAKTKSKSQSKKTKRKMNYKDDSREYQADENKCPESHGQRRNLGVDFDSYKSIA
ncbi:MAG: hypothetical protein O3A29_13245, partial [Planctomycetota bacterium]|nr:hypothetical protein [Planctomycetota bacterium]